jgi:hypothetical protein
VVQALLSFARREAFTRVRGIVISSELAIALAAAILVVVFADNLAIGRTATGDVVFVVLAYAAIAFGFSVAGLTVVLTAPDRIFASQLAWSDPAKPGIADKPRKMNSYSNLLFIFSWTAFAHWLVVIVSLGVLVALGSETPLLADGSSVKHSVAIGLLVGVTIYAVELFLVTVITLSDVGDSSSRSSRVGVRRVRDVGPMPPTLDAHLGSGRHDASPKWTTSTA